MKHPSEDQEQAALIKWCSLHTYGGFKLSDLIFAIPNGGFRNVREAAKLKRIGVRAGVPDLFLPIPSQVPNIGPYAGFFIEMKGKNGKIRSNQDRALTDLAGFGYCCLVAFGWHEAANGIATYLDKPSWKVQ